jgi:hypothetical protein
MVRSSCPHPPAKTVANTAIDQAIAPTGLRTPDRPRLDWAIVIVSRMSK